MLGTKFNQDTTLIQQSDLVWQGVFDEDWCVGPVPNGGYIMAIGAKALANALPHKNPLTLNAYYFSPTHVGTVECRVEVIKCGRSISYGVVKLYQDDELKVQITASFANLDSMIGESKQLDPAPSIASIEGCVDSPATSSIAIARNTVQKFEPGIEQAFLGRPTGEGVFTGWVSLPDVDQVDLYALIMFCDSMPPPVFNVYGALSWVPTIELSIQVRAKPASGPIQFKFSSRNMTNGITEEDGYLWDSTGTLVALSRQTAKFRV